MQQVSSMGKVDDKELLCHRRERVRYRYVLFLHVTQLKFQVQEFLSHNSVARNVTNQSLYIVVVALKCSACGMSYKTKFNQLTADGLNEIFSLKKINGSAPVANYIDVILNPEQSFNWKYFVPHGLLYDLLSEYQYWLNLQINQALWYTAKFHS